eukprot:CAMPEP_0202869454 /NCGR_PEP_ID=MMETSP1391-20130828/12460_1 /ASSEMBLY_ACC=CAM_ASM_000867 /TAXON_ID=1034604 /ORGANISM="Chlamydomonas leiostraca, Strain SAG 11-49" /LENGTH=117 /DNA_ID=CAMNT_0049549771 /DNA_START=667 /DNA_END=1020 /DNA_ORIENTATION=+
MRPAAQLSRLSVAGMGDGSMRCLVSTHITSTPAAPAPPSSSTTCGVPCAAMCTEAATPACLLAPAGWGCVAAWADARGVLGRAGALARSAGKGVVCAATMPAMSAAAANGEGGGGAF